MKVPNLKEIATAWIRAANPTPEQEAEAERRLEICDGCDQKEFVRLARYFKCAACGCPLSKKVFADAGACPLNKW